MDKVKIINELKNIKNDYERALLLVGILFIDKVDKAGHPYVGHLIRVSNGVEKYETKVAGLLHDTIEDTEFDKNDLKELGFNDEIIEIVDLVTTYDKSKSYHDKITSIIESGNIEAIKLKFSDMSDNFDKDRLTELSEELRIKLENKYGVEIKRLEKRLKKEENI